MNNPYVNFIKSYEDILRNGANLSLGGFKPDRPKPALSPNAPKVLVFSPHPDDECITGALSLRILRELKYRIMNVAVTQGSNKERQAPRLQELTNACKYLGFDVITTKEGGLEKINPKTREGDKTHWSSCVERIVQILREHEPKAISIPHVGDWNSTHIGTHYLVMDALKELSPNFNCYVIQSEFWAPLANPNMMVELSVEDAADLVGAISFHVEEVKRNPYHTRLPAWLQDNVRRGGELVGGQGGAAPDFTFAALYRLDKWTGKELKPVFEGGKFISTSDDFSALFA